MATTKAPTADELARAARLAVGLPADGPLDTKGRADPLASQRRLATYLCLLPWWGKASPTPAQVAKAMGLARFSVQSTRTTMADLDDTGQPVYESDDARAIEAVSTLLLRFNALAMSQAVAGKDPGDLDVPDLAPADVVLAYHALRRRPKDWGGRPRGGG